MINVENPDVQHKDKIKDYIAYIDRIRRTTTFSRLHVHRLELTRQVGISYGLTEKDFKDCEQLFKSEL